MSKKSDQVVKVLERIKPRWPLPTPVKDLSLLEHGMLAVLLRHFDQKKAEAAIAALKKGYTDWNEMRVAQTQEVAAQMLGLGRRASRGEVDPVLPAGLPSGRLRSRSVVRIGTIAVGAAGLAEPVVLDPPLADSAG